MLHLNWVTTLERTFHAEVFKYWGHWSQGDRVKRVNNISFVQDGFARIKDSGKRAHQVQTSRSSKDVYQRSTFRTAERV